LLHRHPSFRRVRSRKAWLRRSKSQKSHSGLLACFRHPNGSYGLIPMCTISCVEHLSGEQAMSTSSGSRSSDRNLLCENCCSISKTALAAKGLGQARPLLVGCDQAHLVTQPFHSACPYSVPFRRDTCTLRRSQNDEPHGHELLPGALVARDPCMVPAEGKSQTPPPGTAGRASTSSTMTSN
jgi:hypothetical protein